MKQEKLLKVIELYNFNGWVAFYHPINHTVSLNGGKEISEENAFTRMTNSLASKSLRGELKLL